MKRTKVIIGAMLLIAALSVAGAGLASAYNFKSGMNVSLQDQRIESTVFAAGNTVDISSEVFGDVFCAGQTVTVSGTIHGDVICAGQTVLISGKVDGDVRAVGQTVSLGGTVGGNASVAAQTFNLSSDAQVAGDVSVGAATATFNGPVGRDIAAGGETVVIAGRVGRDIHGTMNNLRLTSTAQVSGNVSFASDQEVGRAEGATVGGTVTRSDLPHDERESSGFNLTWAFFWFIAMLFTALVFALIFPRVLHTVTERAVHNPGKVFLVGFVASIAAPIAIVLAAITVIGLPLALILGLSWIVVMMISWMFFAYYLGRLLLKNSRRPLLIMLTGASVVVIVGTLPIIGFINLLICLWFGAGMLVLEALRRTPRPAYVLDKKTK